MRDFKVFHTAAVLTILVCVLVAAFVAAGAQLSIGLAQYSSAVSVTRSDSPLGV